jgi:hypothetical protein
MACGPRVESLSPTGFPRVRTVVEFRLVAEGDIPRDLNAFLPGLIGLECRRASRRIGNAGMQPERRAGGLGWWAMETWPPPS